MQGKTCLITGATNGIGFETALGLANMGAEVLVHGRDTTRTTASVARIRELSGNQKVNPVVADFTDLQAVRAMATSLKSSHAKLDVLINNAGGMRRHRSVTAQGFETTWGVNHLAPFLLTAELLPLLQAAPKARIVNVASTAQFGAEIDFDDLQGEKSYSMWKPYKQSKLANVMFTYALARRLGGQDITVNCVHPGVVATGFVAGISLGAKLLAPLINLFLISAKQGAQTSLFAATSPAIEGITGHYFDNQLPAKSNPLADDILLQDRLWQVSVAQTSAYWPF